MKKMLAMILALVMSLSLVACGGGEEAPEGGEGEGEGEVVETTLQTITEGVLTVATSPDFAPYEFYAIDENGEPQLAGFDMALAQYIADYLGLTLEVIPMDFDGTIMELGNKNVDISLAGYSPDPERADLMDFSDVYITGGQSFVCTQANKDLFPDLASANNPDYSIGAQIGSIQADLAAEHTPDADIIEMSKVTDLVAELVSGKMDGAFIETMVAESYAKNYSDLYIALEVPYDAEGSVVGVSKGNAELLAGVNEAIAAALADGSMAKFVEEANELANGEIIEGLID